MIETVGENQTTTLFFNFSYDPKHRETQYCVSIGGELYRLEYLESAGASPVVQRERASNAFLRGVPDHAFTHVLDNVQLPADSVQLVHVRSSFEPTTGAWNMDRIFFHIPMPAGPAFFERFATAVGKPLPLSAKRQRYGIAPALSAGELLEERALVDSTDHAAALVGLHPELLSVDPASAHILHSGHITTNHMLDPVSSTLEALGTAEPQASANQPNPSGWATLVPVTDDNGVPLKNTTGKNYKGYNHYNPEWHPDVLPLLRQAQGSVMQGVKDDESLGADVTGVPPGGAPLGTIWHRRDGLTHIDQSPGTLADTSAVPYTLVNKIPHSGYRVTPGITLAKDGSIQVTLNFENWYLRWLGVYIQFQDANGNVVPVSQLPSLASTDLLPGLNTDTEVCLGIITPEFTIYGIPVQESKLQVSFTFPTSVASGAKILGSGLGCGSHTFQDTEGVGIGMTSAFNLAIPSLLLGMGLAQSIPFFVKTVVLPSANVIAVEIAGTVKGTQKGQFVTIFWRALVRALAAPGSVNKFLQTLVPKLLEFIAEQATVDAVEDALPIAGVIIQAVGLTGALVELIETGCEVMSSPWTYEDDLKLTHDLSITFKPKGGAGGDNTTPKAANQWVVKALFDNGGTPLVQTIALESPVPEVSATFSNVPLGGKVNISASFHQVPADASAPHVLLGKATTGLIPNDPSAAQDAPVAVIDEIALSIGPGTVYEHKQKTALDGNGLHIWQNGPAPSVPDLSTRCTGPGTLCNHYNITVRQGSADIPGYLGYAWEGQNSFDPGQQDRLANLNTGVDPEQGYLTPPFRLLTQGARLTYSLLSNGPGNFYLDTNNRLLRQVVLDPTPRFDDPANGMAFGKFNLSSDCLLLHPTGKLVSVNTQTSLIETHQPPAAGLADADAADKLQARLHAGLGTRPGRLGSPCAAAISPDGVVIILEQDNNRIQAFDTGANPVKYFTKQQKPYFLSLDATADPDTLYLDLAVEFTGFIYVLSVNNNLYRLDIYHPTQSDSQPISTTQGVNVARLAVDFWRNVYTLNYEVLRSPNGNVEPTVSLWTPTLS